MIPHKRRRTLSGVSQHIIKRSLTTYTMFNNNSSYTRLSRDRYGNIFDVTNKLCYFRIINPVLLSEQKSKDNEHSKLSIVKRIYNINSKDCKCMNAG